MKSCWNTQPEERPEFSSLKQTLINLVQAVDDGRIGDIDAYYNAVTIIENDNHNEVTL